MLQVQPTYIPDKLYLTKKLEPKTVQKVLGSSSLIVEHMYIITNDLYIMYHIIDHQEIEGYKVKMYVKPCYAYAGEARRQVNNIKNWRHLIRRRPSWTLRAMIEDPKFKTIYRFEHKFTNINHLHEGIQQQLSEIETILTKII